MKKLLAVLAVLSAILLAVVIFTSCGKKADSDDSPKTITVTDRAGNEVVIPTEVKTIISIGPSNTVILSALGAADKIIAIDTYTYGVAGVSDDLPRFDMGSLNIEAIIDLDPDIVIATTMTMIEGVNFLIPVMDAGIAVAYVETSETIDDIKKDIEFLAEITGTKDKGKQLVSDMEKEINDIKAIGETITDKKTVFMEIMPLPWMYSCGTSSYLHEMLTIIGAVNIISLPDGWTPVSEEFVLNADPDVILTNCGFMDDPVGEVTSRDGWDALSAVQNGRVYYIDENSSSQPTQDIIKALKQMAAAIYPEYYK